MSGLFVDHLLIPVYNLQSHERGNSDTLLAIFHSQAIVVLAFAPMFAIPYTQSGLLVKHDFRYWTYIHAESSVPLSF